MKDQLIKINPWIWEFPKGTRKDMNVPARLYATEEMLEVISRDKSLNQLINVSCLPGIEKYSLAMPDIHEGYGFPIGGVAATDFETGVISPGGIGYDINCGIRLLKSDLDEKQIAPVIEKLAKSIYNAVPSGVGKGGKIKLRIKDMDAVLDTGCDWALKEGYANDTDLQYIESNGRLNTADSSKVSSEAKTRGVDQLGTMGAGNHFVEIDKVDTIYDEDIAKIYGLKKGQIVILIHTGSRGLGHQVATDYIKKMTIASRNYGINLPDRELSCAPLSSSEGQNYFAAMSAAANFAWANRQIITWEIREAWKLVLGGRGGKLTLLYDVAHNIAKIESHTINGKMKKVIVHRKGATRAFPALNPEIPEKYRKVGQPVLIPGSMGTASFVLAGLPGSMEQSFGSACHGSGRLMSRTQAKKNIEGNVLLNELENKGIKVIAGSLKGITEEAPQAYKDVNSVVDVVHNAGIAKKVAKLKPLGVIKG